MCGRPKCAAQYTFFKLQGQVCDTIEVCYTFEVSCTFQVPPTASAPKRRARGRILRRHISWENRSAEGRMPSGPALHALPVHKAKPPCLQAGRLALAARLALERLVPKPLQALLRAEPPALLFYRGKRCWMSSSKERSKAEPRASQIGRAHV